MKELFAMILSFSNEGILAVSSTGTSHPGGEWPSTRRDLHLYKLWGNVSTKVRMEGCL